MCLSSVTDDGPRALMRIASEADKAFTTAEPPDDFAPSRDHPGAVSVPAWSDRGRMSEAGNDFQAVAT